MAADDLFKAASIQLDTLPHKEKSADELFKEQNDQFNTLPHKEGKTEGNPLFHGMLSRLLVIGIFVLLSCAIVAFGAVSFMVVEEDRFKKIEDPYPHCFEKAREKASNSSNFTVDEALLLTSECIQNEQSLNEYRHGVLFTWTLAATVGYGNRFPHTVYGQVLCVLYAFIFIPIYMALKIEFGEVLAIFILYTGNKVKTLLMKIGPSCLKITLERRMSHPSDFSLAVLLFGLFSVFVLALASIVMATNDGMSFFDSFYLSIITVLQVGLGDITPAEEWPTFVFVIPLALIGDALASYLNYYIHGIYRIQAHKLALMMTECCGKDNKESQIEGQPRIAIAKSIADFPTITNTMMPLRATSAEVVIPREEQLTTRTMRSPSSRPRRKKAKAGGGQEKPSPVVTYPTAYTPVLPTTPALRTAVASSPRTDRTQNSCRTRDEETPLLPQSTTRKQKRQLTAETTKEQLATEKRLREKTERKSNLKSGRPQQTATGKTDKTKKTDKTTRKTQTNKERTEQRSSEKAASTEDRASGKESLDTRGEKETRKEAADSEMTAVSVRRHLWKE